MFSFFLLFLKPQRNKSPDLRAEKTVITETSRSQKQIHTLVQQNTAVQGEVWGAYAAIDRRSEPLGVRYRAQGHFGGALKMSQGLGVAPETL